MGLETGLDCAAYRGTGGTFVSPTYTNGHLTRVVDVTISRERTEIPASSRGSAWEKFLVGLKKMGIDIKLLRDNADTNQIALETAYEAGTVVMLTFADGPIGTSGTKYVKADFVITKFSAGEPLEGVATIDMTVKLAAASTNDPTRGTI